MSEGHVRQLPCRNILQFRGGLVFKALRLWFHSTLGLRVILKKKKKRDRLLDIPPSPLSLYKTSVALQGFSRFTKYQSLYKI
jgi:hypothetical protein